jgi:hypothetical protein
MFGGKKYILEMFVVISLSSPYIFREGLLSHFYWKRKYFMDK